MILFIEDEPRQMESFRDELELSGHQVALEKTVDGGLKFLRENSAQIKLIILDVMMPPGEALKDEETRLGLESGVRLFERIRRESPETRVVVFTNVTEQSVKEFFKSSGVIYLHKRDYDPEDFVKKVEEILSSGQ